MGIRQTGYTEPNAEDVTIVRVDIAPNLLRWAVRRARWDEETARKRVPKFDAWIDGTVHPTLKQMEKFAVAAHTPSEMLFLPEPLVEDIPIPDMRTIRDAESAGRLDERSVSSWLAAITDLIEHTDATGVLVMVNGIVGSDTQ